MSLRSDCRGIVPHDLINLVPGRFDVIGDIAIIKIPDLLMPFSDEIVRAVMLRRKGIHTVARKVTKIDGDCRVARFELLAGASTETLHTEYGYRYWLDITEAFFAPRLATEHSRIAELVRPEERVLVPFAGVGPFAIPAAARNCNVTAIEKNPSAFRYLEMNARENGVAERMNLIRGDVFNPHLIARDQFDRAIVPAPYGMDHVLKVLSPRIRDGGAVHFYTFSKQIEISERMQMYADLGLRVDSYRTYARAQSNRQIKIL